MAYKRRLDEFSKKMGIKPIKILKIIRDDSSHREKGMGYIRDKTIKILKIIRDASSQPNHNLPYTAKCV